MRGAIPPLPIRLHGLVLIKYRICVHLLPLAYAQGQLYTVYLLF